MFSQDCCGSSVAPVNIVGAPGLAGAPGPSGALVLLGQLYTDFRYTASFQTIPINSLNYIITQVVIAQNDGDLQASVGGIYVTSGGVTALVTPWTFSTSFAIGTWRNMPLAAAAQSLGSVLTGPQIYVVLTVPAAANPAHAYINVYGYAL